MKKNIFILIFLLAFVCQTYAQKRFRPGLKAGISTSQVAGDTYGGFHKAGVDAGAFLTGKINENWSAQFEIDFVQKGSKHVGNPEEGDYTYYYMGLNYLEVPVLAQYHHKKFVFELGPGFAYLINSQEYNQNGAIYQAVPFKSTEISGAVGVSFVLYKHFSVNWRYTNSLRAIRPYWSGQSRWYNGGQRNNVLAFSITYQFGKDATE